MDGPSFTSPELPDEGRIKRTANFIGEKFRVGVFGKAQPTEKFATE
jgi:hypothetical protein